MSEREQTTIVHKTPTGLMEHFSNLIGLNQEEKEILLRLTNSCITPGEEDWPDLDDMVNPDAGIGYNLVHELDNIVEEDLRYSLAFLQAQKEGELKPGDEPEKFSGQWYEGNRADAEKEINQMLDPVAVKIRAKKLQILREEDAVIISEGLLDRK